MINDLNLVWSVDPATNQLIPVESFWGSAPRHEVLQDPNRVLVFDFGSEVYVWNGRSAPFDVRRLGVKLAKDLWEQGLEETSPVPGHPLIPGEDVKRPDWSLLGKVIISYEINFDFSVLGNIEVNSHHRINMTE